MCEPASMIVTRQKVFWSETTDSHHEIIREFGLKELDARREINVVPVEVCPPNGNLSLPLSKWEYKVDFQGFAHELPEWYDPEKASAACRSALKDWATHRLKGWKLKEAFKPVHPLKIERDKDLELLPLLKAWASVEASVRESVRESVRASVWASVGASVWASVRASVGDSVWESVRASVGASVGASVYGYIGSLFHNITNWKYTDKKNPWRSIRKLWLGGYVPSFDGTTWRLHAGLKADVVFEISAKDLRK